MRPSITWPEAEQPTPEQFRDWFLLLEPGDQVELLRHFLDGQQRAGRCFMMDHSGRLAELEAQVARQRELLLKSKNLFGQILDALPPG